MKKTLVILAALMLCGMAALAVPADPTPHKYIQPDGSIIVLQLHGDEYCHWTTNFNTGEIVEADEFGYYRPAPEASKARIAQARAQASAQVIAKAWSSYENPPVTNFGDRKVLCIIANFSDSTFVVPDPRQHFSDMLNQEGYNYDGAIGSVRDYYIENSLDQYRPQFDVFGPAQLTKSSLYYDVNGVDKAIMEAYNQLASQINISDYDTDGNGKIDMVLFYYPGHNEAEGANSESIWPHQATGNFGSMGGKALTRYFCTSELRGRSGNKPASIGTTCHEFAHSLGLPDFYDTDYEENGGQNITTAYYDLMAQGSYNDSGRKPPYLGALERNMLGWMDYPVTITASGDYTLDGIQNNVAYRFDTTVSGEYFIVESRNGDRWDSYLTPGLLFYHVDKSSRRVTGRTTAAQLWNNNMINAYGGHPCYYLIESSDGEYAFPGHQDVSTYLPTDWNGDQMGIIFTNIAHDGNSSSFKVSISSHRTVTGTVKDTDGTPLKDVEISLTPSTAPFAAAPSLVSGSIVCMTGEDGFFSVELDDSASEYQILAARKEGYTPQCANLTINAVFTNHDIVLFKLGEIAPEDLYKFDNSLSLYTTGFNYKEVAIGVRYEASELAEKGLAGSQIKTMSFISAACRGEDIYLVIDIGREAVLRKNITDQYSPNSWITVNILEDNIFIPEGKTMYLGYGIVSAELDSSYYPFYGYFPLTEDNGQSRICKDFLSSPEWRKISYNSGTNFMSFPISATISRTIDVDFSMYGVSTIGIKNGTPTVSVAADKSLMSKTWYIDGELTGPEPAVLGNLEPGAHTYMVVLEYYDGTSERVYYDIDAE